MTKPRLCTNWSVVIAKDLTTVTRWLTDCLGFSGRSIKSWRAPYVDLVRDGLELHVVNGREMEHVGRLPKGTSKPARSYAFAVEGLRGLHSELVTRQAKCTDIYNDGRNHDCFVVEDPEGNRWKFWERRNRTQLASQEE